MNDLNGLVTLRDYGHVVVKLSKVLDERNITRNKLRTLTGVKYEVIDRYYKAINIEMVDLDFLAKVCCVLNCSISDLLEYVPNAE
ncbi:MAG: helix-turn-helix domain-containing protein [Oscillospiraceae bacterium]|jgi:DNA-binding Xre family transcriptional regulator